jgi:hypothetical protein
MKRMISDGYIELVRPMQSIQEGIERNLIEIPHNTRKIIEEVEEIKEEVRGLNTVQIIQNEGEIEKLDNITKLGTLNLLQVNEMKSELKLDIEEVKVAIKEIHQKVIEYGISQSEQKHKEIQRKEEKIKKEKKAKETPKLFQGYKSKKPPPESSSSSSSSDEEKGTKEDRIKSTLKERKLTKPNLIDNELGIDYIKNSLVNTDNGTQFGKLMKKKGYKFTRVHKMYPR